MFRYISIVVSALVLIVFSLWSQPSKAECQIYEENEIGKSGVEGLDYKYFAARRLLLFVSVNHDTDLPSILQKENISKIAKKYIAERMLPCTGHKEVELVEHFYDERLQEENVLIAYVNIRRLTHIPESANSSRGYRPKTAMITGGYYRTPPYEIPLSKRPQILDSKIDFISLEQDEGKIRSQLEGYVKLVLKPNLRYSRVQ